MLTVRGEGGAAALQSSIEESELYKAMTGAFKYARYNRP